MIRLVPRRHRDLKSSGVEQREVATIDDQGIDRRGAHRLLGTPSPDRRITRCLHMKHAGDEPGIDRADTGGFRDPVQSRPHRPAPIADDPDRAKRPPASSDMIRPASLQKRAR